VEEGSVLGRCRRLILAWVVAGAAMLFAGVVSGQMVTGSGMDNFAGAFGLTGTGVEVHQTSFEIAGKPAANVLWPRETAAVTFYVKIDGGYQGPIKFDVVQYGTRAIPGDMWKAHVFKIGDVSSSTANVDLPPKGGFVTVRPKFGETFGGYAILLDIPGKGRYFGATCCRTMAAEPGRVYMPTYALDLGWPFEQSPIVFNSFKKLGIKGARVEGGYNTIADAHTDWAMQNDVTLMLTVGAGNTPHEWQPLGRGRPWLNADGSMKNGQKEDQAWMPQYDLEFKAYLKDVLTQYGWPKGPVNAVELWNEPWEGVSISGWGADMLRYRQLYKVMAQAVLEARKEAGVKVMIGGTCSSSNTRDKLFSDGTDDFLPILDFVSIHYQALAADPALERKWMSRQGEYGRVRVWDTESWIGNSDDRVAAVIASMRAMGQDRTAGIFYQNVNDSQKPHIDGKEYPVCQVWAPGAAVAAATKMIGQRAFKEILYKNGLPWVFVFDGLPGKPGARTGAPNVDDSTLVVVGDLGKSYERGRCLFRSVNIQPDARMTISDGGRKFIMYDFYGNPLPSHNGKITVPINGLGYFLRSNGTPGSFAQLEQAVKASIITGVDPVEIVASDMTAPISVRPTVRVRLTNVLNRTVAGKLTVKLEGLTLATPEQAVTLKANESRTFAFTVTSGNANDANNYPLLATFTDSSASVAEGEGSKVEHSEVMHVNYIAHRTITVDGNLDHWQGAIPQTSAQAVGVSMTEQAYLPFKDWNKKTSAGPITAYLGYDDRFFYFAAKAPAVAQTIRYGTRDDDSYFYPEQVTDQGKELTWPAGIRRYSYSKDPDVPGGHNIQIAFNVIPEDQKLTMLPYPASTEPRFCAYQDTDYEFALNPCKDGGTEIFCLAKVGAPHKHYYPRQPKSPTDGGPVGGEAKLVCKDNVIECAIPWSAMPEVQKAIQAGRTIKFTFRSNEGGAMELAAGRSISKINPMTLHNDWSDHWANELEFGIERPSAASALR
jgi:hypothetical protein